MYLKYMYEFGYDVVLCWCWLQSPVRENVDCEPWTQQAKYKYAVEQELAHTHPHLNYVIARPALVYGPGDRSGLGGCHSSKIHGVNIHSLNLQVLVILQGWRVMSNGENVNEKQLHFYVPAKGVGDILYWVEAVHPSIHLYVRLYILLPMPVQYSEINR